ncbi:MAG: hypothetical protein IJC71_00555 [Clostridia bacterium]|nr:hypothetical protein [Clostridia bacterium]
MKKFLTFLLFSLLLIYTAIPVFAGTLPTAHGKAENLAPSASEFYASTEYNHDYRAARVADGVVWDRDMRLRNWVSNFAVESTVSFYWEEPVTATKMVVYGMNDTKFRVLRGILMTEDGGEYATGVLPADGAPVEVVFDKPHTMSEAHLVVTGSRANPAVGLSEVEFYNEAGENVARLATVYPDSEYTTDGNSWDVPADWIGWYIGININNGWADYTVPKLDDQHEWACLGEQFPEIMLSWDEPITVGTVVLSDRVNANDWILSGTLKFSDGTEVPFTELANYGEPLYVDIPDCVTESLTVSVTESLGPNPGFAEIEVYTEHFDENGNVIVIEEEEEEFEDPFAATTEESDGYGAAPPQYNVLSYVLLGIFAVGILLVLLSLRGSHPGRKEPA